MFVEVRQVVVRILLNKTLRCVVKRGDRLVRPPRECVTIFIEVTPWEKNNTKDINLLNKTN